MNTLSLFAQHGAQVTVQHNGAAAGMAAVMMLFMCAAAVVGLALFGFWLWMLIDAIRNPRLDDTSRIIWVLVIVLLNALGALIYLLVGRSGNGPNARGAAPR